MRTIPFTNPKVEEPYTEKEPDKNEPPAGEAKPETKQDTQPTTAPQPQKNFLQKYWWIIVVAVLLAAAWFMRKYQIVPKIPIPAV